METKSAASFRLSPHEIGERLDKLLSLHFPKYSRTYFQELIEQKRVLINGAICKKREKPSLHDEVSVLFAERPQIDLAPENIPLEILYEDEFLIAINKPPGMVVHPAPGSPCHTFVNALLYHCKLSHEDSLRPGIVHRLDKDTSGLLLAAKTEEAHGKLVSLFSRRQIEKTYLAVVYGHIQDGLIDLPIGRHPKERKKMAAFPLGGPGTREAKTVVETLAQTEELSLLKISLLTGRTHQIRVHLSYKNAPVLGDITYGSSKTLSRFSAPRQLLHAYQLSFLHPLSKIPLSLKAPIPQDFLSLPAFHSHLNSL